MASNTKIKSAAMNKARWSKDVRAKHGSMRVTIHSILYEWFSPTEELSNYGIWNLGMVFQFPTGKTSAYKKEVVIESNDRATPEYYKRGMIREIVMYRDFRYYTDEGQHRAFDKTRALIDKITRDKKIYEELTAVSEDEAIKKWTKFVIYRIKRGNKMRVL
jgi:hypothetical protein